MSNTGKRFALAGGAAFGGVFLAFGVAVLIAFKSPRLSPRPPYVLDITGSERRVLWLGDSTVTGVGATSPDATLPRLVQKRFEDASLKVLAVSGARVADVVADQIPRIATYHPTDIFISIGANDVTHLTGRSPFEREYRAMLLALPASASVVVLGVPDMGVPARFRPPLRQVARVRGKTLDAVARRLAPATYVDIAGETGAPMRADRKRNLAADGFHPSDAGYELWARAVLDALGDNNSTDSTVME